MCREELWVSPVDNSPPLLYRICYHYTMIKVNSIIQGDCLEVMKDIEDGSVDCIVTSPPYWKGYAYEAYFNSYAQYLRWSEKWLAECKRVLKPNGNLFLNVINDSEITVRAFDLMQIATENLMYKLHDSIIWYRYNQQPANTTRQLTNQVEYVFLLRQTSDGIEMDKKTVIENHPDVFKTKNVGNVWEMPFNAGKAKNNFGRKETKSKYGHSGFPITLPEICIELCTKENDVVLDLFAGTGTTGLACKNLNRNYILIEKEPEYIEIIKERLK